MRTEKIFYKCGDCSESAIFKSYHAARKAGWCVAGDYKRCWCPIHAAAHRLGGANGKSTAPRKWLPDGFKQISFDDVQKG